MLKLEIILHLINVALISEADQSLLIDSPEQLDLFLISLARRLLYWQLLSV